MRIKIILSLLIISIAQINLVFTEDASPRTQIQKFFNCAKGEAIHDLSTLVFDLYYNRLNVPTFLEKLIDWNSKSQIDIFQCVVELKDLAKFESGRILTKLGLSLLFGSNCSKDVGPALIILDNVLENLQNVKEQWKQLVTNGVSFGIIAYQSFKDCKAAAETIKDIWTK